MIVKPGCRVGWINTMLFMWWVVLVSVTVRLFSDRPTKNQTHTTDRQSTVPRRYRLPSLYRGTKRTQHQSSKHGFVQRSSVYSTVCLSIYPSVHLSVCINVKRFNQFHPLKISTLCRGLDLFLPKLFLQTSHTMTERSENEQWPLNMCFKTRNNLRKWFFSTQHFCFWIRHGKSS